MKVIKIGAVWCSGCLVMRPRWEDIEKQHPWLVTEYHDFDTDKETVQKHHVDSGTLPVAIFLDGNGNEILRLTGEVPKEKLVDAVMELKDR